MWNTRIENSGDDDLQQMQQMGYFVDVDDIDTPISRVEAAVIISRVLSLDYDKDENTSFLDDDDIEDWAKQWADDNGYGHLFLNDD